MKGSRGSKENTGGYRELQLVKGGLLVVTGLLGITGWFYLF